MINDEIKLKIVDYKLGLISSIEMDNILNDFIKKTNQVNCSMCNDSGAVVTGCSEDGHTIYSECPCVSDKRTLAKQIVKTVNELFHLQETQDWEEKAINEVLKYI